MREKYKEKFLQFLIIFAFSIFTLLLFYRNQLPLYIHPRYITSSFVSSIVALVISILGMSWNLYSYIKVSKLKNSERETPESQINYSSFFVFLLILGFCLLIPARSLTSATASQRNIDVNAIQNSNNKTPEQNIFSSFSTDTETYSIGDWVSLTKDSTNLSDFKEKKVKVSGFIYKEKESSENIFLIARFVVTCCAVDARPIGLPFLLESSEEFKENDWIEIQGKFEVKNINNKETLVIIPDSINKIERPEYQYLF